MCGGLFLGMWKNDFMNGPLLEHYIGRAADFYAGMDLTREENAYRSSSALLAIHSAISYSDALRTGLGDEKLYADDHRKALGALQQLLRARSLEDETGFAHFEYLVSMKSFVCYGDKRLDAKRLMLIALRAERFANWVSKTARQLKLAGWRHDGL